MKYTIFSIDGEADRNTVATFVMEFKLADKTTGNLVPCEGSYKGVQETSFICLTSDFNNWVLRSGYVLNQESVLRVSECNKKYTTLEYLDKTFYPNPEKCRDVFLGCMKSVTKEEAYKQDAWTYRADLDQYFIAVAGNNDHYPSLTSEVDPAEVSRFHGERIAARTAANGQPRYV